MSQTEAPTKQILMSDMLTGSNYVGTRRLKTEQGSTAYNEGRKFRAFYDFTGDPLPVVLKFEISSDLNLESAIQDIHDGALRYRVFTSGVEGGTFTPIGSFTMNNKSGVPVVGSGLTISVGGTLDVTGIEPDDIVYIRTSGASGQTSTVENIQGSMRGFPATTAYVVVDKIPSASKDPAGVLKYEWSID